MISNPKGCSIMRRFNYQFGYDPVAKMLMNKFFNSSGLGHKNGIPNTRVNNLLVSSRRVNKPDPSRKNSY